MPDSLAALQRWYLAQCDGDWEHSYGISVSTLDNPGWSLKVELVGTAVAERQFDTLDRSSHPSDWLHCCRTGTQFEAWGGPLMLGEMIAVFLEWAQPSAE